MTVNLEQHKKYSKSPELFMKECWLTFNAFNKMQCDKPIKPFDYQIDLIRNIHNIDMNIIVKSRQMHMTSMMAVYIAWYVLFNSDKMVAIVGSNSDAGKRILDHVKIILQYYSVDNEKDGKVSKVYFHWEDDFVVNNKTELKLRNGSRIKVLSASAQAGRGELIDLLYIDEAAYIKDLEYIWMGLGMAVTANKGKIIIASSPQDNSYFNKMYLNANENSFMNTIRLHWSIHPQYSIGIKRNTDVNFFFQYTSPWHEEICKMLYNNSNRIDCELECVLNLNVETKKEKTISLRIDDNTYNEIKKNLKQNESVSDYIRNLITKDIQN